MRVAYCGDMFMYPTFCKTYDVVLIPAVNAGVPGLYLHLNVEYFVSESSVSFSYS